MTTHELAKNLLQHADVPVVISVTVDGMDGLEVVNSFTFRHQELFHSENGEKFIDDCYELRTRNEGAWQE